MQETSKNGFKSDCPLDNLIQHVILIYKLELLTESKSEQQVHFNHSESFEITKNDSLKQTYSENQMFEFDRPEQLYNDILQECKILDLKSTSQIQHLPIF